MKTSFLKTALLVAPLLLMVTITFARERSKDKSKKETPYIGFYRGKQYLDVSNNGFHRHKSMPSTTGFYVRLPLISHFKIEGGLAYNNFLRNNTQNRSVQMVGSSVSLPITIQYYIRPQQKRLQPFIGVGALLSPFQPAQAGYLNDAEICCRPDNHYASLLFTQGITFSISTKIDVVESIHIMPEPDRTIIGFNVGIGFHLP